MKLLIAGGGTGGHLFPGLAVAEEWVARGGEVVFVGTARGLENTLVPKYGFRLELLEVRGLKGSGIAQRLSSLKMIPNALLRSRRILRREKPDRVLGIGGYASGPTVLTAALTGHKTAIIEQNSVPGVTNRILGKFVSKVYLNFEEARPFFPDRKIRPVGNPVLKSRKKWEGGRSFPPNSPMLLVCGGSQGAKRLNEVMKEAAPLLAKALPQLKIVHQTGNADCEGIRAEMKALRLPVEVHPFIDRMEDYYRRASLIVSRSGAGMLTEIACWGLPSVLVPFPFAADDHQKVNAASFVSRGAAEMIEQANLSPEALTSRVISLLSDPATLKSMSDKAFTLARPEAAKAVVDDLLNV